MSHTDGPVQDDDGVIYLRGDNGLWGEAGLLPTAPLWMLEESRGPLTPA